VREWPTPRNTSEVQTFLGFSGFYRKYVPGYSSVAYPLLKLIKPVNEKGRVGRGRKRKRVFSVPFEWGTEQQVAFDELKRLLVNAPVLKYPDPNKPYTLHVDACRKGLGAVLYQEHEGKLHPVAYASRSLTGSEKNYTVHKLEFLALKWAVTQKFQYYLCNNNHFVVFSDHNPLVYVTSTARLDANGLRWVQALASFNFTIKYKPGKSHSDADGLSRRPHPEAEEASSTKVISAEVFRELCDLVAGDHEFVGVAECLGLAPTVVSNVTQVSKHQIDWAKEQDKDLDIWKVKQLLGTGVRPDDRTKRQLSIAAQRLVQLWDTLSLENNVLMKASQLNGDVIQRVVIPRHKKQECLNYVHDKMGHLGVAKTYGLAQERFFWTGLKSDVEAKVRSCARCVCAKSPHLPERAPLVSIVTSRPMEAVFMDFLGLETSKGGFNYILVITDHYTKYAAAFPTRNQEAKTVARILVDQYFTQYGIPERINTDQGASFQGRVMRHLCEMLGVQKTNTTFYHPQSDGIVERYNKTLLQMLRSLENDQKADWKSHVQSLTYAYNCSRHESTGFTPFYLMFGRKPRIPVDVFLGREEGYCDTVTDIRTRLETAYKAVENAAGKSRARQARNYDQKVRGHALKVGDAVLLKNIGLKGKHKLADKWQSVPYTIIEHPNTDIPVFKIKQGKTVKTVHRNNLLPVQLPLYTQSQNNNMPSTSRSSRERAVHNAPDLDDTTYACGEERPDYSDLVFQVEQWPGTGSDGQAAAPSTPQHAFQDFQSPLQHDHSLRSPVVQSPHVSFASPESLAESVPVSPRVYEGPELYGNIDAVGEDEDESEEAAEPQLRRSQRAKSRPDWYGNNVMSGNVNVDWRDRLSILLSLYSFFPAEHGKLFNAMMAVISGQ
jgi:hypothetical protein